MNLKTVFESEWQGMGGVQLKIFYILENASKFKWSSIAEELNPERVALIEFNLTGTNVLDVGCGGGGYVRFLKAKVLQVTGVDLHQVYLDSARQRDPDGTYLQGDITGLSLPDKEFDCSICFDLLEHVENSRRVNWAGKKNYAKIAACLSSKIQEYI